MERLTLDDIIKALKCVASQDVEGNCYKDHENFKHMEDDKYKRIVCETGEDLRDYISGKEAVGCPYYQNTYGCCFENGELYWLKDVAELLEELKSYKDLEEQGLLVRLPCKVGDLVFIIDGENICRRKVKSIKILSTAIEISTSDIIFHKESFGETVFLTREEAGNKLEEMRND